LSGALAVWGAATVSGPAVALAGQQGGAADELVAGRRIYRAQCLQCHGEHGKGDGRAACDFEIRPADLTDPDLADESDASLLRKVMHARKPMPNYESSFSGGERRAIVAYLRELASSSAKHAAAAPTHGNKGRGA
jgi:mono/diheme cytochrome c family protein